MRGPYWTQVQLARLRELHAEGLPHAEIGARLNRSEWAVRRKLQSLGCVSYTRTTPEQYERVRALLARECVTYTRRDIARDAGVSADVVGRVALGCAKRLSLAECAARGVHARLKNRRPNHRPGRGLKLLAALADGPARPADLARALGTTNNSASNGLHRLKARGLVVNLAPRLWCSVAWWIGHEGDALLRAAAASVANRARGIVSAEELYQAAVLELPAAARRFRPGKTRWASYALACLKPAMVTAASIEGARGMKVSDRHARYSGNYARTVCASGSAGRDSDAGSVLDTVPARDDYTGGDVWDAAARVLRPDALAMVRACAGGVSHRAIGERLGLAENTVSVRLAAAYKRLRESGALADFAPTSDLNGA